MEVNEHLYSLRLLFLAAFKVLNDAHQFREKMVA
jgi:hypothetical protein